MDENCQASTRHHGAQDDSIGDPFETVVDKQGARLLQTHHVRLEIHQKCQQHPHLGGQTSCIDGEDQKPRDAGGQGVELGDVAAIVPSTQLPI